MEDSSCVSDAVYRILQSLLGQNTSKESVDRHFRARNITVCYESGLNGSGDEMDHIDDLRKNMRLLEFGESFFSYCIPFIITIGLIGNSLSFRVFTSKSMRKMSVSLYLAALALSDVMVLMTYVFFDWLSRGLRQWPGGHSLPLVTFQGFCQMYLFLAYTFRLVSVWLIVIFTVERYIGVCKPLHRREMCTNTFAKRAICSLFLLGSVIASYKPILCESKIVSPGRSACTFKPEYETINFVLDTIYALMITAVPFVIISSLNLFIVKKLLQTRRRHKQTKFLADENIVKLEFTFVLLVISTCFIALNIPYFVVWCQRMEYQMRGTQVGLSNPIETDGLRGQLFITRTIFCVNYCTNFFLYALTGRHFRRQLGMIMGCRTQPVRRRSTAVRTTQLTLTTNSPRHSLHMTSHIGTCSPSQNEELGTAVRYQGSRL